MKVDDKNVVSFYIFQPVQPKISKNCSPLFVLMLMLTVEPPTKNANMSVSVVIVMDDPYGKKRKIVKSIYTEFSFMKVFVHIFSLQPCFNQALRFVDILLQSKKSDFSQSCLDVCPK